MSGTPPRRPGSGTCASGCGDGGALIGPDDIRDVVQRALDLDGADGVEVLLTHEWGGLTRFANSSIHQSTWREDTGFRVRVVREGRLGIASTNDFSKDGAARAAASALELARVAVPDPQFPGLAPAADAPAIPGAYDEATADMSPGGRAEAVAELVGQAASGFRAAGAYETTAAEVALANTEGQFCYAASTQATITAVVSGGEGGAGTAEETHRRAGDFDSAGIGARASRKARDSQRPGSTSSRERTRSSSSRSPSPRSSGSSPSCPSGGAPSRRAARRSAGRRGTRSARPR